MVVRENKIKKFNVASAQFTPVTCNLSASRLVKLSSLITSVFEVEIGLS